MAEADAEISRREPGQSETLLALLTSFKQGLDPKKFVANNGARGAGFGRETLNSDEAFDQWGYYRAIRRVIIDSSGQEIGEWRRWACRAGGSPKDFTKLRWYKEETRDQEGGGRQEMRVDFSSDGSGRQVELILVRFEGGNAITSTSLQPTYDAAGNIIRITRSDRPGYYDDRYNAQGEEIIWTLSGEEEYYPDGRLRSRTTEDSSGRKVSTFFDENGNPVPEKPVVVRQPSSPPVASTQPGSSSTEVNTSPSRQSGWKGILGRLKLR